MALIYPGWPDCKGKERELARRAAGGFAVGLMSKALALRPKGKHPLHMLGEIEVWPADVPAPVPGELRERVLAGLPRMERAAVAWSSVGVRPDKALQEIFHSEDRITPADVPRLCCALPGIGGCLLSRRLEVLASWNMPLELRHEELLASVSGAMDRAVDAGDAGWGEARGLTIHLEAGTASLLRSGGVQLLLLHEKRGFAPGVREKLTLALGAVARLLNSSV